VTIIRHGGEGPRSALERLIDQDRDFAYILDKNRRFQGVVSIESLKNLIEAAGDSREGLEKAFIDEVQPVSVDDSMQDILPVITRSSWPVPVVDEKNVYQGAISKNRFLRTLHREAEVAE
jgi:glycine betaine/proline transport system ATP-binding protein